LHTVDPTSGIGGLVLACVLEDPAAIDDVTDVRREAGTPVVIASPERKAELCRALPEQAVLPGKLFAEPVTDGTRHAART
jgi:hypothetical protein